MDGESPGGYIADWCVEFEGAFEAELLDFPEDVQDALPASARLLAGDESGRSERRFSRQFIAKADRRFATHLDTLRNAKPSK